MTNLRDFQNALEKSIYGETSAGCCVECKQPFSAENVRTEAGWRETKLSKMCETCWDKEFS